MGTGGNELLIWHEMYTRHDSRRCVHVEKRKSTIVVGNSYVVVHTRNEIQLWTIPTSPAHYVLAPLKHSYTRRIILVPVLGGMLGPDSVSFGGSLYLHFSVGNDDVSRVMSSGLSAIESH